MERYTGNKSADTNLPILSGIEALTKNETPEQEEARLKLEIAPLVAELMEKEEVQEALELLKGIPGKFKYHNRAHTEDVIRETILFAVADGASRDVIEQQVISAAWHDIGFLDQATKNELLAIDRFKKSKSYQTLSEKQRAEVINNISDTEVLINKETNKPELLKKDSKLAYILDADVSNFGRIDFFDKGALIAEEEGFNLEKTTSPEMLEKQKQFYVFAIGLLENYEWKTASAGRLREAQRQENLRLAKEELARLNPN